MGAAFSFARVVRLETQILDGLWLVADGVAPLQAAFEARGEIVA
jgi:hypothetical protein